MRQPDDLPAFCRVHRNGRPLTVIMSVILVKLIMACSGSGVPRWRWWC